MTSEGPQHPGHEPEEVAPHGGHATASDGRYPPSEHGAPAAGQQGWVTHFPSQSTSSNGWEVDDGIPQGRAAVPAWNGPDEASADAPWAAQQPPTVPWAAQPPSGAGAWAAAPDHGATPQAEPPADREAAPETPRLRWATTDIPQPRHEPTPPAATPASQNWGPGQAWGVADQSAEDPAAGEQRPADRSAPVAAEPGADLPMRQRGRYTENLYQSDGSESLAFGAMSHDSGELPQEARDRAWPDQAQPAGTGYGSDATYPPADAAHDQGSEPNQDDYPVGPGRYEQVDDRYQPAGTASGETQWDPPYQPAPAPGITPAGAVPLPPQETRVPGAALAAAPPADFEPSGGWSVPQPRRAEPEYGHPADSYPDPLRDDPYPDPVRDDPPPFADPSQSAAGAAAPVIPQQRSGNDADPADGSESGGWPASGPEAAQPAAAAAAAAVSASASVPLASRVMPPTDRAIRPSALPSPQPRVYGRPAPVQPDPEEPAQYEPTPYDQAQAEPAQYEPTGYEQARAEQRGAADVPGQRGPTAYGNPVTYGRTMVPDEAQEYDQPDRSPDGGSAPPARPEAFGAFPGPAPAPFGDLVGGDRDDNRQPAGPPPFGPRPTDRPHQTAVASVLSPSGAGGPEGAGQRWSPNTEAAQERFNNFTPEPKQETKDEAPTPQVRNFRVLAAVLAVAVLLLVVPLGAVWLFSGGDETPAFDPAVGECVKQAGENAEKATCGDPGAFKVTAKVPSPDQCSDPKQPHIVVTVDGKEQVLCLQPATAG